MKASQHSDTLLACLITLAKSHGVEVSAVTLLAGLPLQQERLTPSLFSRAAEKAGFVSQLTQRSLPELNSSLFPAVLLLDNKQACLLMAVDDDGENAHVVYPELNTTQVKVTISDLAKLYSGHAIYARPARSFKAHVADIKTDTKGHWFWQVIKQQRGLYRDILLAAVMINIFALAMPLFVMNVYDRVVPNFAVDTLWVLAIGVGIVLSADLLLKMMRAWFVDLAASRVDITISSSIMARVLGLKMSERPESVGSFSVGLQAFESVRSFIGSSTITAFVDLPFVILFTLVIGLLTSWYLVIPIIVGVLICLLYTAAVQAKMQSLALDSMQASAHRNSILVESLHGLESIKMLRAEGKMQRFWEQSSIFLSRTGTKMRLLSGSVVNGTAWVQQMVAVSIIIIGVYLIVAGDLTQGGLIASYMLSSRIMAPIGQTSALLMQYHQAATALAGVDQIMNKSVERAPDKQWLNRGSLKGQIEFKGVYSRYPNDDRDVLKNVSFKIEPGERVALLGRNGSGKSTIEKIIAGLYEPSQGHVLVDGIDIRQLDLADLRFNLGYVGQDATLFLGSLRDNITMACPSVSDSRLLEVIKICGLGDFINQHPLGLDMPVGEQGELLSGGQRQSICIARALINDPQILLFDEPTGAMDHNSEETFKKSIETYGKGKTFLVVTHRTSLLNLVDRIIVIDGGRIMADGPKEEVMKALSQGRVGRAS